MSIFILKAKNLILLFAPKRGLKLRRRCLARITSLPNIPGGSMSRMADNIAFDKVIYLLTDICSEVPDTLEMSEKE